MDKFCDQLSVASNRNLTMEEKLLLVNLQQEASQLNVKPSAIKMFDISMNLLPGVR